MLCSISGQVPVEPVVSTKSGLVFEKRLVLQYLTQNQSRCPITNDELDAEKDLLTLKPAPMATSTTSSNGTATQNLSAFSLESASIPQILALFQNEWDAVMLETFSLKKHLEKTRQELSHALYQHDAACRVIARLNAENESLRTKVAARATSSSSATNGDDVDMDAASDGLSAEAIATIEAKQKALAKQRKDFKKKERPLRAEKLAGVLDKWTAQSSHTIHDADKPGILSVAIDAKQPHVLATGGVDKQIKVFNTATQQLTATLRGHSKKVSDVAFHPTADLIVSASHDKTVKIWSSSSSSSSAATSYTAVHTLADHEDAVTGVSVHATGDYLISASLDGSWGFADIRRGKQLARYFLNGANANNSGSSATASDAHALCVAFHPDGGIFGTGAKHKLVQMWDVKSMANVVTFEGHTSAVNSLVFSENGYQLATGSQDGVVHVWDLRKLKSVSEIHVNKMGAIYDVAFDASGAFLAVAGAGGLQVLKETGKTEWTVAKTFEGHKAAVTSVAFAPDASYLATTSMDRSLKLYR